MNISRLALASILAAVPSSVYGATGASFSYDPQSEYGPESWAKLDIAGNACGGESNSPIAVETRECDRYENYRLVDGSCTTANMEYSLTNTGVKASFPGIQQCQHPSVEIPGISGTYRALQFHIHTSSEHTIDGEFFGAELHTVHQEIDGDRYAVVGMMINPSADQTNELFEELLHGWEDIYEFNEEQCSGERKLAETGEKTQRRRLAASNFSPYMLIPDGATFYHYDGGLTTPPCSEVVWWNLADKAVSITPAQYNRLVTFIIGYTDIATCKIGSNAGPAGSTSRPTQPLNGRYVDRICPKGFVMEESTSSATSASVLGAAAVAGAALLF